MKRRRKSTLGTIMAKDRGFKARYWRLGVLHTPGHTFASFELADQWLIGEQLLIDRDEWTPPAQRRAVEEADQITFGVYSARWIAHRQVRGRPLKARTAADYRAMRAHALARFLDVPITAIDRAQTLAWYESMDPGAPVARSHAYALFRSILASAVEDGIIATNPVHVRGASGGRRHPEVELFTVEQVGQLADLMPPQHRAAVLIAAWCGLRFGELAALRRSDIELNDTGGYISVARGIVTVDGHQQVTTPKSDSGERRVPIPRNIWPDLREHLKRYAQWGKDGLLFPPTTPGTDYLTPGQLYGHRPTYDKDGNVKKQGGGYYRARHLLGRDDLSFHKLRHFAATNYAVAGATTKELMTLMGHADPEIAMRYQHAAHSRIAELADRVSELSKVQSSGTS